MGPTPIHQGLDSEIFDSPDNPYSETLVREAIQNSLDAQIDPKKPVSIDFTFHNKEIGLRSKFIDEVIQFRKSVGLKIPDNWKNGRATWLLIQDFNTHGLRGPLNNRRSDFWNYWLNFGQSNKASTGRGGRGIGRTSFLIASQLNSVIGYTKSDTDPSIASCGMAVLRTGPELNDFKSTHAYLAKKISGAIYSLHDSNEFHEEMRRAFLFANYGNSHPTGLGIAVLYHHDRLNKSNVLAAAIEHFAPSIIAGELVLSVNSVSLNTDTIDNIALDVADCLNDQAIKEDVSRYISIIRDLHTNKDLHSILVPRARPAAIDQLRNDPSMKPLQERVTDGGSIMFKLVMPLVITGKDRTVSLRGYVGANPVGRIPIDRFFRKGMSLPDVKSKVARDLDVLLFADDGKLVEYLNDCEGKAHLDLHKSEEVKQKLRESGFDGAQDGLEMRHFIKGLATKLRNLFAPESETPDVRVFDSFFSKPITEAAGTTGLQRNSDPPAGFPSANPMMFKVVPLADGLNISALADYGDWPTDASIRIAYADGTSRPAWDRWDFLLEQLSVNFVDCNLRFTENLILATACGPGTKICITGFDSNRELDVKIDKIGEE